MPWDWILERIAKEWSMIKQTPLTFALVATVLAALTLWVSDVGLANGSSTRMTLLPRTRKS